MRIVTGTSPLSGPWLFMRSRSGRWLGPLSLLGMLAAAVTPVGVVPVPFREELRAVTAAVFMALPGAMVHLAIRRPSASIERNNARLRLSRLSWWAVVTLTLASSTALVVSTRDPNLCIVVVRNLLIMVGLTTLAARWLQAGLAWLPALAYAGLALTYGTVGADGGAEWWALPMHPASSAAAWVLCALATGAGWAAYAVADTAAPRA
ncbi:hypothetical protein GCM10027053_20760 [Intrasporangium mesophilum]